MSIQSSLINIGSSVLGAGVKTVEKIEDKKEDVKSAIVPTSDKPVVPTEKPEVVQQNVEEPKTEERPKAPDNSQIVSNAVNMAQRAMEYTEQKKEEKRLGRNPNAYMRNIYGRGGRY